MTSYLLARMVGSVPTVLLLVLIVVLLARIVPGNVIDAAVGDQGAISDADREQIEHELGLDRSVPEQYVRYLGNLLTGSLGESLWSRESVLSVVTPRLRPTIELAVIALIMALIISLPLGVWAAVRANSPTDYTLRIFSVLGLSVPSFVVASYVMLLPAMWWGWFVPIYEEPSDGLWVHYKSLLIPAGILAVELSAALTRLTRTCVLESLRQDYVRTARSKGLRETIVLVRHVVRNSLIPVVSVVGLQIVALFSGVVIIEQIFGIAGVGQLIIASFQARDYTMIQGITVLLGFVAISVNILADLSYVWLNPRIRLA